MSQTNNFGAKLIEVMMRFVNMKGVVALKDGMLSILPLTVVGSLFLVIGQIPSADINNWIASIMGQNWTEPFMQVYGGTFAIMGMIACFAIAYAYVTNEGYDALPAGVLSVASFFITTNSYVISAKGEKVTDVISKGWTGGQGIVAAIIIGLTVGAVYSWFMRKNIVIKMPDSVPKAVSRQFTALIPAAFIFTAASAIYAFFKFVLDTTFIEWIYKVIQLPLQGLTDTLPGVIGIAFFISFLWWFGVHGQSIVNGIVFSLLTANAMSNTEMLKKAGELTVQSGAHIVTQQFLDSFLLISGSGITFGLVVAMLFAAKSEQYKSLGKLSLFPAIFNINEPVTFGFPIVLNPLMFIPFVGVPVLSALLVYGSIAIGFVQPFSGVLLPWSTPAIISGLMVAGWKGALLQIVIMAISVVVYYPFFRKQDQIAYQNEQGMNEELTLNKEVA
ncbi:MAG: PTS sugar transporter subunit IIC [Eubacteriaceae bacterium]|nr:PTS sugar transporter subunit IIC [Eubacteriaceae bacterium]